MIYKGKILFLRCYISVMENNEIIEKIEILILPMIYNDLLAFLASHISHMENNEISSEIEMDMFDLENPYITYGL